MTATVDVITPIDEYLAAQRDGTAVELFARRHDAEDLDPDARWYADRLPTSAPKSGEQYAFRVDLDACTGCKACVAGCHSLNGLDDGESWRSVGLLVGDVADAPRQQTVPGGCHHCVEPACLSGCPTNAYEKDPFSGIVRHLDDQCFGCGYCELTCPYEVPKMNARLGIVRKCDLCADRLAEGEAPACVQACPTSAITVTVVDTDAVVADSADGALVPGAPASSTTAPTTQYVSAEPLSDDLHAADDHALHPAHGHTPLAVMLVLNQASVGVLVATLVAAAMGWPGADASNAGGAMLAAILGTVAVAASFTHLGRPLVAWRAFLGIRTSWMSREIVAFATYTPLAVAHASLRAGDIGPPALANAVGWLAFIAGVAGVVCSVALYVVTRRRWWTTRCTAPKFAATTVTVAGLAVAVVGADATVAVVSGAVVAALAAAAGLLTELAVLKHGGDGDLARTARLLTGPLASSTRWRFALGSAGGLAAPAALLAVATTGEDVTAVIVGVAVVGTGAVVAGHLIERLQFFLASAPPRMPGGFNR